MAASRILVALATAAVLGLAGCDDDGDQGSAAPPEAAAEQGGGAGVSEAAPETPDELAEAVYAIYVEGLGAVAAWAGDPPPLEEARAELTALKEDLITRLVALGRIREGMSEADRASFNAKLSSLISSVDRDMYSAWNDMRLHYNAEDAEFGQMIYSLNVLTQYASFDLLKEQEPEEAARLGIE